MPASAPAALPRLSVTSISQYIRLENCERFLRFRLRPDEEKAFLKKWGLTIQPLTPLLKESGSDFERGVCKELARDGEQVVELPPDAGLDVTIKALQTVRKPTILVQAPVEAPLGRYLCHGRSDVIRIERNRNGALQISVADIKASRHERMEHRLQVAIYAHLLQSMAAGQGIPIAQTKGAVLCMQEDGHIPSLADGAFDLDTYLTILGGLAAAPGSTVDRIAALPFEQVFYHLGYKCDGCLYNAICMYDSAERLDLSLAPYLTAVDKRVLLDSGIRSLPDLAGLMDLPARDGGSRELTPAIGREDRVAVLRNTWPVGQNLPNLVQRARRALSQFDRSVPSRSWLYGAPYGTLPSDEDHAQLVKVFFDAQRDYLADRVYMISAQISGPRGSRSVVRCLQAPPADDSERQLLIAWILDVIRAVQAVAAASETPVHLYCYNPYDQKVLLQALKRHLEQVAALPAFFDLMTQSAALSQPIISFLADEVRDRLNLGMLCNPLHDVARRLAFDWKDDRYDYFSLFRARLFDNRRTMLRSGGLLAAAGRETAPDDPRRVTIEAASRFNSQIPLEYAYAAWNCLPHDLDDDRTLDPFRQVNLDQLQAFAAMRVRALAHIEGSFRLKARFVQKPPVSIPSLMAAATDGLPLSRSLVEFLHMEHHAALQAKLQIYSLPIERRVQTGLALLLRHTATDGQGIAHCAIECERIGLDPVLTMNGFRLKEGDWVVVNPADPPPSAGAIKHGRLAIMKGLGQDRIELGLLDGSFYRSKFRYPHDSQMTLQPGALYTLDQMADDLNADKALDSLQHTDNNTLYQWLAARPADRPVSQQEQVFFASFAGAIDMVERPRALTQRQREVIGERLGHPLFLVQGPPGTGKSHTLAWAVLARIAHAASRGIPCRVAVSCKTHNAVNIVLAALAEKQRRLVLAPVPRAMRDLRVCKLVNDGSDGTPDNVEAVNAYGCGPRGLESLLQTDLVVIGGTPGGLYNLARYRALGGKTVDWQSKPFDLLVIDEASQMSVPEAILAAAFLQRDGHAIIVGDHRQMPPIIAHPWEEEHRRTATTNRPYLSLFESLLARDFPHVGLDESFRLHQTLAAFLEENVYRQDDIPLFSRRTERLTQPPAVDEFVDLALDPRYPIVVIEHSECRSQQYNETEVNLVAPLIDVCANRLRLDGLAGIGVVVPHRAQKAMLRKYFPDLAVHDSIDTVERFQGGERDVIIVSATASDPDYVLAEADFLLNLNRLNVALSRPRKKLIVVASQSVINLLVSDLDIFSNAIIWKRLYHQYASDELWHGDRGGVQVWLRGKKAA